MKQKLQALFTFRNIAILGLLLCIGVTAHQFAIGRCQNFVIFQQATFDFWNGISPYGQGWLSRGYDYYLYSPIFNVLFAPFAYLPSAVGVQLWNIFNYALLVFAIHSFRNITDRNRASILLFLIPILVPALMSTQYNIAVAAIFVLAFSLLERGKAVAAIVLIIISGTTKIYGIAELAILVFYPHVWRNIGYSVLFGVLFAALPLVKYGFIQYVDLLGQWVSSFSEHKATRSWDTIYDVSIIPWGSMRYVLMPYIQVGVFAVVSAFVLMRRRLWVNFDFRIGVVALIMGWCILFGNSSETHTYLISVVGFLLWYYSLQRRSTVLKVLFWAVFVVIGLVPIDLLFPQPAWHFIYRTLDLNKWVMFALWVYMIFLIFSDKDYKTVRSKNE